MNLQPHNDAVPRTYAGEAEETLRLIAGLAAPDGLEDRVQAVLARAPRTAPVLPWPLDRRWMHGTLARGAAAAAIVCFVAGGGWEVYSRVQPVQAPKVIAIPRVATPGGFASANAMRTPKTVNGPTLTHPIGAKIPVRALGKKPAGKKAAGSPAAGSNSEATKPVAQ
ncbi:MAG: hypothetical protein WBV28_02215 [Terracidiphilus sp.]